MWVIVMTAALLAAGGAAAYALKSSRKAEMQKYYSAAYQMLKEISLNQAIKSRRVADEGFKIMVYLKWKDGQKQGYVFDPEQGVRIGRAPGENEICIRESTVSSRHCMIYVSQGQPAVLDMDSANGTWIRRGLRKHAVNRAEYLLSGDVLIVGLLRIKVTIFTFDMAYM